jgi:hypothetical protein
VGDSLLGQAGLLGEDPVTVDHDSWRGQDLLDVHVHRAGNASELLGDLLGHMVVRLRFWQRARDLNVDRRGQAEVEDLAYDVRRLREELDLREPVRQLVTKQFQVFGGRAVRLLERHQDLAIGRSDRDTVAERQVDGIRQADVVDDHIELVGGDDLADMVLDLLPRSWSCCSESWSLLKLAISTGTLAALYWMMSGGKIPGGSCRTICCA